jgi:tRNA pseudouridine55 synthase
MMNPDAAPDGVLLLDKPTGPTSHDMVALARRALRTRRVGHTGTLDPFASGLLLLCIGPATRVAEYLSGLDKRYIAQVRLGVSTDTDDFTGRAIAERDASAVTRAALDAALAPMHGRVMQRPPAYSAKKREGERAYRAAREGRALEIDPVTVRIDRIEVTRFEHPLVELDITCGSGTYIRAVARDLGEALGVGAHLSALRRTRVGQHGVEDGVPAASLDDDAMRVSAALIPATRALAHLPQIEVDAAQQADLRHGRALHLPAVPDADVLLLVQGERLLAVARSRAGTVRPAKVLA